MLMQRWRILVLVGLVAAPLLVLIGLGCYHMWLTGLGIWLWWPLSGCIAFAYVLAWRWQKKSRLLPSEPAPPLHWTERDREAWHLVEARAKNRVKQAKPEQFTSFALYIETAENLALELARFYHPKATDPVGALTIPEILTVIELATHDLAEMVDQYLPGGHLLTINDMRRVKKMADWYPMISNVSWLISSIFNPVNTIIRYTASQAGMTFPWQLLQQNVLEWFYIAYVHRLGSYLIELNSGRLGVGAQRFRQLQQGLPSAAGEPKVAETVRSMRFVVMGQAKAGKSSLINALLGQQRAITDVVVATAETAHYDLKPPGIDTRLQVWDTVGYAAAGPKQDQVRATEQAAQNADLIILVLHARNPARQADLDMLEKLHAFFRGHPELRRPPMLAVLTHIDLLSPAMEWQPPYDWQHPERLKEQQIQEAVAAVRDQLGRFLDGVIPVCTAPGKILGIDEWLFPALAGLFDQAHAVAFLHCLKAEMDTGKVRKVFHQLLMASKELGNAIFQQPMGKAK